NAGDLVLEVDLEQGIALERIAHEIPETNELGVGERAQPRPARDLALERLRFGLEGLRGRENLARLVEQPPARRGQRHAGRFPLEQREVELILEGPDLRGKRRLADVQLLGRAGQMARFGDYGEAFEAVELHRQRLRLASL